MPVIWRREREGDQSLLRARSSVERNLRFVSGRRGNERGAFFLPRASNHSPTEVGMSGDVHLFVDETGRAHPADLAKTPGTIWRAMQNRQSRHVHFSVCRSGCCFVRKRIAPMLAWLPGEESAGHCPTSC